MAKLEECEEPTLADSIDVLSILYAITMMTTEQVIHQAYLVSPECIESWYGIKCIKGLSNPGGNLARSDASVKLA
jgi:hypothetical protein